MNVIKAIFSNSAGSLKNCFLQGKVDTTKVVIMLCKLASALHTRMCLFSHGLSRYFFLWAFFCCVITIKNYSKMTFIIFSLYFIFSNIYV